MAKQEVICTVGRRKSAVARVRMTPGTGKYIINGREFKNFFVSDAARGYVEQPFVATDSLKKFDIQATIKGGGNIGQAGALRHGIARALVEYSDELKPALKSAGMLTRDARVKERKKPGQPGARKRFQFSKR